MNRKAEIPVRLVSGLLALLAMLSGCPSATPYPIDPVIGTETGNPPVIDDPIIALSTEAADSVRIVGEEAAISPGGVAIEVDNLSDVAPAVVDVVDESGAFDLIVPGKLDDLYSLVVRSPMNSDIGSAVYLSRPGVVSETTEFSANQPFEPGCPDTLRVPVAGETSDRVDLLFVIDNSRSMLEEQESLARELPELVRVLATGDVDADGTNDFRPVESLHLGVVSTDMGVTGGSIGGSCSGIGGDGQLLSQGDPTDAACAGQNFPRYLSFAPGDNAAMIGDAFSCISRLGTDGCGLEQQLDAALKAVVPSQVQANTPDGMFCDLALGPCPGTCGVPGEPCSFTAASPRGHGDTVNAGFLQEDSLITVVLVTDEDDCSIPDSSAGLFQLQGGPFENIPINLRCYEEPGSLYDTQRYVQGLRGLRPGKPEKVIFSAITGVPQELIASGATVQEMLDSEALRYRPDCSSVSLEPGCNDEPTCKDLCFANDQTEPMTSCQGFNEDGSSRGKAYPPRRILETVQAFGKNGVAQSICQEDFGPAVDAVIAKIAAPELLSCIPLGVIRDGEGRVQCEVSETVPLAIGCDRLGRTSAASQPGNEALERCAVTQLSVDTESDSDNPAARLIADTVSGRKTGWYYDDFSAEVQQECESSTDVQRIAFTEDILLAEGATLEVTCTPAPDACAVLP